MTDTITSVSTCFVTDDGEKIVLAAKDAETLDRFIKAELRRVYDPARFQTVQITKA